MTPNNGNTWSDITKANRLIYLWFPLIAILYTNLFFFLGVASSVSLLSSSEDESSLRLAGAVGDASPSSPLFFLAPSSSLSESESILFFATREIIQTKLQILIRCDVIFHYWSPLTLIILWMNHQSVHIYLIQDLTWSCLFSIIFNIRLVSLVCLIIRGFRCLSVAFITRT